MSESFNNEVINRFKLPWKNSAFKYYFFWIVCAFGGLGFLLSLFSEFNSETPVYYNISRSISSTFIALIAASLVDLQLSFNIKNIPSLIINSIACIAVSLLLLYFSFSIKNNWSLIPALLGYGLGLFVWILANADNENLSDEIFYKKMLSKAQELSKGWDQ